MGYLDNLTSTDIQTLLHALGISFDPNKKGWQTILSPIRKESKPSFSINITTGGWIDHGTDEKGGILKLVMLLKNFSKGEAYSWIINDQLNVQPPNNNIVNKPSKVVAYSSNNKVLPKNNNSTKLNKERDFDVDELLEEQPQERLKIESHLLLYTVKSYDLISKDTLLQYHCGIREEYGKDWISIPYQTGIQLYRREDGEKVIRMVKGSKPKESFFGIEQLSNKPILLICKSPREAMMLSQRYGQTLDVVSITSGEMGEISQRQTEQLRSISKCVYTIKVLFDCDTAETKEIARSFCKDIARKVSNKCDVQLIDIYSLSDKKCKDITDYFKKESDPEKVYQQILSNGQSMRKRSPKPQDIVNKQLNVQDAPPHSAKVYESLPNCLSNLTDLISKKTDKDIFLQAALPVLASHLPNVIIPHNDGSYSPDIYSLVFAKPGAGKGIAEKARKLGQHLNDKLLEESKKDMARWESLPKKEREQTPKPIQRQLFLPGNTSSRALYDFLQTNDGRGLIFETEIDTLINAARQDWGDFTDVIRKSFHHEPISLRRKTDDMYIERPELSIFMSGTFDQFKKLFESAENGHFSRYAYYTFEADLSWRSHRPTEASTKLYNKIDTVSAKLLNVYQTLKERKSPLVIQLEDRHWDMIDNTFKKKMRELEEEGMSRYLQSSNQRLAIITIRIAALVCVIRNVFEVHLKTLTKSGICITDADLEVGIRLANNFFDHAKRLFQMLPKGDSIQSKGGSFKRFYYTLPQSFQTNEAYLFGFEVGVSKRTVRNYLSSLVDEGLLLKKEHGTYNKVDP